MAKSVKKAEVVEEKAIKVAGKAASTMVIDDPLSALVDSPNKMKEAAKNISVPDGVPVEAEQVLLKRIIQEYPHVPLFAIIRDTLDDSDPCVWDDIINEWVRKDYYIPIYGVRDGYLTELGLLYARNEYGLVFQP